MQFLGLTGPLLIDGGMATSLEAKGVPMHPTLWSGGAVIDAPDKVTEVHAEFLQAGADIAIAASYQLSPQALGALGYDAGQIRDLLVRAVQCALAAGHGRRRSVIAGGMGPYGAFLCDGSEYRGQYGVNRDVLAEFHRERFEILSATQCDAIVFETVPCLEELQAIAELCAEAVKPIWISVCCLNARELASGESLADAVRLIDAIPSVMATGVNCVNPRHVASHLKIFKGETSKPLFVYPNLGQSWDAVERRWRGRIDEASFLSLVDEWISGGADAIGGCCGVGSNLIRAIGARLAAAS